MDPPLHWLGEENIPNRGPGAITVNHYSSPTFWAPWLAVAISALVPGEITWTVTDAFTYTGSLRKLRRGLSHLLLTRMARVYGFNSMPPMPPVPGDEALRAASVRRLMAQVRASPDGLVGLAPEGCDRPGGVLGLPPSGAGRLALALAERGLSFFPVGAYEEGGVFWLRFGPAYRLEALAGMDRQDADLAAREQITREIARLLPERLRGGY
jgi:hypothetical protein